MIDVVEFHADIVELSPDTGFVGLANSNDEDYFWMQPDEMSDAKESIWLERHDQMFGGTGKNWKITLTRNSFELDSQDLNAMACNRLKITFAIDEKKFSQLWKLIELDMKSCPDDLVMRF